jgi:uncharacterized protein (TIGR00369 family)
MRANFPPYGKKTEERMAGAKEELKPLDHTAQNLCFGCGHANATGLRLEFFLAGDGSVVALPTVTDAFEGPRGFLHGGIVATLLDEAMSKSVRVKGFTAMTRHLEVEYLKPVPSRAPIRLEGRAMQSDGRKHHTEARILDSGGAVLAKSRGLFIEVRQRDAAGNPAPIEN